MDNSVSNIQLTPEAKRMIEGEIAYQTSGAGFWIQVVVMYVISVLVAIVLLTLIIAGLWNRGGDIQWLALLLGLWLLIPGAIISSIHRAIKYRRGPAPEQKST